MLLIVILDIKKINKHLKIIVNKNLNLHIVALLIFSSYYFVSLLLFNSVAIYPLDNLENIAVYNHIISNIYNGDLEGHKLFLSGEFKWFYLDKIFFPINLFHLILGDKQFFFFIEILQSIVAYFSFYLFSKFFLKNKQHAIWGAILYFNLVNMAVGSADKPTIFLSFLPYILYLTIIKKNLNLKHLIIVFIIGLNSSLVYDFPALSLIIFFSYFLRQDKNNNRFILIVTTIIIGMIISATPTILSILGEPTHRVILLKPDVFSVFKLEITTFINSFIINDLFKLFNLPMMLLQIFLLFSIVYLKNKKIIFFLIFLIITYILNTVLDSDLSQIIFNDTLVFLQGYNFARVSNLIPFFFSILLVLILNYSKNINYKKLLISMTIISSISLQVYFPLFEFTKEILKKNIKEEYLINIKKNYKDKNFENIAKILKNKDNYSFDKINFNVDTKTSFDNYYKIETYKKIKKIVGNSRVASLGIDPMIAPMNDINAIDGYHQMFSLSYKKKFRKIIEEELKQNENLKNYYDNWGNRIYMFFSDKNNLLIDFKEAKKVGADFIISAFPINNENLKIACPGCEYSKSLYLYIIL